MQNLRQEQKKVSDYSYNYKPGASEPEAQKFREANQSGQTRVTDFSSGHSLVQDQASQYDELGRLANELEDEAKKLQDQATEMDQLAQKAETNADHLESRTDPGGRAGEKYGEGGTDHPNGYMQTDPSAKLARGALANQKTSRPGDLVAPEDKLSSPLRPGSGIMAGANANYPTRAADNLSAITGGAGAGVRGGSAGASLRDQLKARLKEQYGREPSASEVEQAVARAAGAVTGTDGTAGAAKPGAVRSSGAAAPSDDPAAAFNKGLGTGTLEIAGSETDASVAAMMRELAVAESTQNRVPASVQGADVGAEEGPTLFERAHATHRRCEQRGCVNWRVAAVRGGG